MNTTNATTSSCDPQIQSTSSMANFAAFYVLMPLSFLIGGSTQLVALMAFRKQTKSETGYAYQIQVTANKIIEIAYYAIYVLITQFFGGALGQTNGYQWFYSSYILVWYSAYFNIIFQTSFITLSILFSTSMAVDRAIALCKPMVHRNFNHKKHQVIAVCSCVVFCILGSIGSLWQSTVVRNTSNSGYYVISSSQYSSLIFGSIINYYRICLRFVCIFIMAISYALIIYNFEKRLKQVAQMTNRKDQKKDAERRRHQRMLLILIIFHLPIIFLTTTLSTLVTIFTTLYPSMLRPCQGSLIGAVANICYELSNTFEILVVFCFSPRFRLMIFEGVPKLAKYLKPKSKTVQVQASIANEGAIEL